MDATVLAAIARWPNVPAVFGWLSLTARGEWRIRGEPIANAALRDFIGRNYAADDRGRWYFQNGPQRVYVELELAPLIFRLQCDGTLRTHTGEVPRELRAAALVDGATFALLTELGPGSVDDRDAAQFLAALANAAGRPLAEPDLEAAFRGEIQAYVSASRCGLRGSRVLLQPMRSKQLGSAFGFDPLRMPG